MTGAPSAWPSTRNCTLAIVAPGVVAAALAVTVWAAPAVSGVVAEGNVTLTDGAALTVTGTLAETPRLPKLSVTSALSV